MMRTNRNIRPLLLVVLAAVVLLAGTASAGWFDKKKKHDDVGHFPTNKRIVRTPAQSFVRGELQQGVRGTWMVGNRVLQLAKGCLVLDEQGVKAALEAGQMVLVTGTVVGDVILARQVRRMPPDGATVVSVTEGEKEPSASNPDVGVLKNAPE